MGTTELTLPASQKLPNHPMHLQAPSKWQTGWRRRSVDCEILSPDSSSLAQLLKARAEPPSGIDIFSIAMRSRRIFRPEHIQAANVLLHARQSILRFRVLSSRYVGVLENDRPKCGAQPADCFVPKTYPTSRLVYLGPITSFGLRVRFSVRFMRHMNAPSRPRQVACLYD